MGSNKKHKTKKHKTHSREIRDEPEASAAAGKMKVIFRVPPPHPSSPRPDDPSLMVSLPLEEIARARQYSSEEGSHSKTHIKKKQKKKHHHHHHHKAQLMSPPSSFYGSVSEKDNDDDDGEDDDQFEKEVWSEMSHKGKRGGGKDFSFHKMPGKEMRVQAGPYLDLDEDEEEEEEEAYDEDVDVIGKDEFQYEERERLSLPVEIDLEMLSLQSKKPRTSGKEWKSLKTPKICLSSSISISGTPSIHFPSPPIKSPPPPVVLSPIKSPPLNTPDSSKHLAEAEKKKKQKKKKKHKHHHGEESPVKKAKKSDGKTENKWVEPLEPPRSASTSEFSPAIMSVPARQEEETKVTQEDLSLTSDLVVQDSFEPSQSHTQRQTHSPDSTTMSVPSPASSSSSRLHGVKLPRSAFRYFLKHLHHQIQRNDPEGVFAEPVTDDIAPGYSSIIKQSMDLQMMAVKIDNNNYSSVEEFKDDFMLMCNNAMTYNAPETQYYQFAKQLLNFGLKLIEKEMSLRPDIRHGLIPSSTASPQPPSNPSSVQPPSSQAHIDYTSPFLCKLDLSTLRQPSVPGTSPGIGMPYGSNAVEDNSVIDVSGEFVEEQVDQSHLTQVQVGFDEDAPEVSMFQSDEETEEEILRQVDKAYIEMKENVDANTPQPDLSFLSQDDCGKTYLHILNPDSVTPRPVDLTSLAEKVKAGENASTVLSTELPVFKATPVSYLMYGPFGSFAPTYDTSFANLTKHDSSLLLSTYGNELGVSYANSLQQFVKGCGSFATEMADAILNSLTNGRHMKFVEIMKKEEEERKKKEEKDGEDDSKEDSEVADSEVVDSVGDEAASNQLGEGDNKANGHLMMGDKTESVERLGGEVDQGDKGTEVEDMEVSNEMENQQRIHKDQSAIEDSLSHTSRLLMELESEQQDRLSQPAQLTSQGNYVLPCPSGREIETATQVSSKLVSLTSRVNPADVSSIPSLHRAMGIVDKSPKQTT